MRKRGEGGEVEEEERRPSYGSFLSGLS